MPGEVAFKLYDTYRLPARSDPGRAARPRHGGRRPTASRPRWRGSGPRRARPGPGSGEAATETRLVRRCASASARPSSSATTTERAEGDRHARIVQRRRGGRACSTRARAASLILNQTPFYGESGGQVGDTGDDVGARRSRRASPTRRRSSATSSSTRSRSTEGAVRVGLALELEVDHAARSAIRANHSATHLLHEALRQVLGDHVAQKGSLVVARPAALRLRASEADHAPRNSPRSRTSPTRSCCRTSPS